MAQMSCVNDHDVAVSLGRTLSDTERAQVLQWIGDAQMLIRNRLGDLDALDQDVLAYVVREAVVDHARNPDGFKSETIDDYRYERNSSAGRVQILDEWWELLSPDRESEAFTITPYSTVRYPLC